MNLLDLPPGVPATISSIRSDEFGRDGRLTDVGFVPGTELMIERFGPLGGPVVVHIRDTRLGLRRDSAVLVEVELITAGNTDGRE